MPEIGQEYFSDGIFLFGYYVYELCLQLLIHHSIKALRILIVC